MRLSAIALPVLISWLALTSCGDASDKLPSIADPEVNRVLSAAIRSAGGWRNWRDLEEITYRKRSILYLENGAIESDMDQIHHYRLIPELSGTIRWTDSVEYLITYSGGAGFRSENGTRIGRSEGPSTEAFLSNYYVLFIPFKLLDEGTHLYYEGIDTLDDGSIADVIRATYDPDSFDNHSTSDAWWYYFDRRDGRHLASKVLHAPTYAWIENVTKTDRYPLRFNLERKSFRCDSSGRKEYLRGVFTYSSFEVISKPH